MVQFTIKEMLENGVHYGHNTRRWNPKMSKYIYGTFNGVHIINLQHTAPMMAEALEAITKIVASGGRVLFVGTKKQAAPIVKEYAEKCGQYYINHRWLGGMLTNNKTISQSIGKLEKLDAQLKDGVEGLTKKEILNLQKTRDKLDNVLGGIKKMSGLPDLIIVLDSVKESISIEEANKLNIPIVAIVDTNSNVDNINYPVPGNDDAVKAIKFYCDVFSKAVLEGLKEEAVTKESKLKNDSTTEQEEPSEDEKPKSKVKSSKKSPEEVVVQDTEEDIKE